MVTTESWLVEQKIQTAVALVDSAKPGKPIWKTGEFIDSLKGETGRLFRALLPLQLQLILILVVKKWNKKSPAMRVIVVQRKSVPDQTQQLRNNAALQRQFGRLHGRRSFTEL